MIFEDAHLPIYIHWFYENETVKFLAARILSNCDNMVCFKLLKFINQSKTYLRDDKDTLLRTDEGWELLLEQETIFWLAINYGALQTR